MIEQVILEYMKKAIDVPVHMERPENPPEMYVLLEKTGSGYEDGIYSAVFIFQSYADTLYEAAALNELLKQAIEHMPETEDEICRCQLNSDYNYTDTAEKKYRYQAVYDITHY